MEQVHIHICDRSKATAEMLAKETGHGHLVQTNRDKDLYCLMVDHPFKIKDFASTMANFYNNLPPTIQKPCKELIGAGIIQDSSPQKRTWACVSTISGGPQGKFCQ